MMTGMFFVSSEDLMSLQKSKPDPSGNIKSKIINSQDAWEIFEDTLPFLEEAKKRGFKLIITSNFDSRIYNVCEHFGISKYIDCFTISSESGSSKPDPKFFFKSLSNANASLETTLHVGDNPKLDFLGAKDIGLACYLIDREKAHSPIEHRINSLNSIWDLI